MGARAFVWKLAAKVAPRGLPPSMNAAYGYALGGQRRNPGIHPCLGACRGDTLCRARRFALP